MKTPFRYQATNFDCAPTAIINGLKYLFRRKDIPPFVLQRIYRDCLDVEAFQGTSSGAIHDISHWLTTHRDDRFRNFAVKACMISGKQVHLRPNSKIVRCLEDGGVALLCVHVGKRTWHYLTCLRVVGDWHYCHDPAPLAKHTIRPNAVEYLDGAKGQQPNVRIKNSWLDRKIAKDTVNSECVYIFGNDENRECLLLNRIPIHPAKEITP